MQLTASEEDYILAIGRFEETVHTSEIARSLDVAASSVTSMFGKLIEKELLAKVSRGAVKLTDTGRDKCAHLQRRHRLIELFLVEIMGFSWDEVHEEAHVLEHSVSEKLLESMNRLLNQPTRDPHGQIINSEQSGGIEISNSLLLSDSIEGVNYHVTEIDDSDSELLRYLAKIKLFPGTKIRILRIERSGGTITLLINNTNQHLGLDAASRITIKEILPNNK